MPQLVEPRDASQTAMHARLSAIDSPWSVWGADPPGERFSAPRLDIPTGLSPSGFALRTAGSFAA